MKKIIVVAAALMSFTGLASAQTLSSLNGNWSAGAATLQGANNNVGGSITQIVQVGQNAPTLRTGSNVVANSINGNWQGTVQATQNAVANVGVTVGQGATFVHNVLSITP